ncbi:hypothetical protein EMIT0P265_110247 [Pseudomonas zeae]
MRVEIGKRLLLARHQGDEAGQGQVFEHIGVIAGMEGVTIIHGCSCEGRKVYLLPGGKSGVRSRADKSLSLTLALSPRERGLTVVILRVTPT